MKQTHKVVFYETKDRVGMVDERCFNQEQYETERKIIRFVIADITTAAQEMLLSLFEEDKEMYNEIIKEELNINYLTINLN